MDYNKRIVIVGAIGVVETIGSFVVGGFVGMPFTLLGAGILTIPILIALIGKKPLWRKYIFTIVVLFVAGAFTFSALNKTDYWVIKKINRYTAAEDPIDLYVNKIQTDTDIRGYKTFNIGEGGKAIVLSLGKEMVGSNIEVLDVEETSGTTIVYVRSFASHSTEKNPTIIIGLDRLKSEIEIRDTDGTVYEKAINK